MKKLLLLLLFTITANAQFQNAYPPISECDDNNDQFAVFDLTQLIPQILAPVNASDYSVSFYTSGSDAGNNTNPIANPTSYSNLQPAVQTLYIRIFNNTNSVVNYATVDIRALPTPNANPATLSQCDVTELPIYNFSDAIVQITGGNPNVSVTFYLTMVDAQTGSNQIQGSGYTPIIFPGTQTLFVRVQSYQSGCFSLTTLTLNTHNCGDPCPAPTQLTATNISDTSFTINWNNVGGTMGSIFNRVCIIPLGAQPSDSNSIIVQAPLSSYVITGLSPNTCYEVYVKKVCDINVSSSWSAPLLICMQDCINSGNCAEALVLNAFIDSNTNGVKDNGESNFSQGNFIYQINDSGNNLNGSPNNGTYYIFDNNPTNSYDFSFQINGGLAAYYASNSTHSNITLTAGSGTTYLYFPITVLQAYVDAGCYIIPQNLPRPGFTYNVVISYRNNGSATIPNGTVTFTKDANVTIYSISQTGVSTSGTGFTYDFTDLAHNEVRTITVTMQVPTIPTVNLGDFLTNSASIQITNDIHIPNNSSTLTQMVVGSYDPNDKAESHGGRIVFEDFTANDYLYYTIRFENTGTANAEFIRVEDWLNADLDETTFEMLNASHTVNTRRSGNQLTWHFYNIDLPPTVTHPNDSHGYVYFRIKPKPGYAIGDVIPNTASIFFDYNPPIVTNTFNTEFVENLGTDTFETHNIRLYPNPAQDFITITNSNGTIAAVSIFEVSGKRIYEITKNQSAEMNINTSAFAKGLYLIEITTQDNHKTNKKLIIK
ncbi:MAG: T9SS type A sorting domain-containing protein [Bacteroidia bacterium]